MNDLPSELKYALDGRREVGDRKVWKRESVAGAGTALVQSEDDPFIHCLPAASVLGRAGREGGLKEPLPETSGPFGLIGRKFDQKPR